MNNPMKPITLVIMEKEYHIGCPDDERDSLMASVDYLNAQLRQQRESGKVIGAERVAVMAALNIVHEFLEYRRTHDSSSVGVGDGLDRIQQKVEAALARSANRAAPGHD